MTAQASFSIQIQCDIFYPKQIEYLSAWKISLGCFNKKTRTSSKLQILSCPWSITIFQSRHSLKVAQRQTIFLRIVCVLAFPSLLNLLTKCFVSSLHVLSLQSGLQKYTFQVIIFKTELSQSLSRLTKVLKLICFVIHFFLQKNHACIFFCSAFLLK